MVNVMSVNTEKANFVLCIENISPDFEHTCRIAFVPHFLLSTRKALCLLRGECQNEMAWKEFCFPVSVPQEWCDAITRDTTACK